MLALENVQCFRGGLVMPLDMQVWLIQCRLSALLVLGYRALAHDGGEAWVFRVRVVVIASLFQFLF